MGIKRYKPTTPGRRGASVLTYEEITKKGPDKSLITIKKKKSGRNFQGKITVRHQGGGNKKFYRMIDFKRDKFDMPAKAMSIEYDPNRTAFIALIQYQDGEKKYILAPTGLKVGDEIISSKNKIEIKTGNRLKIEDIPIGMFIHDIELKPGRGGKIVRSAGSAATILAQERDFAQVRLSSGEVRMISRQAMATIGQVSNIDYINVRLGKAGRMRHLGVRPTVRGKAMNPVSHPHGGGEGVNPIGLKHPKTPWGKPALGVKTRKKGKYSDRFILKRRK
jgi:large subunit ribosomal protein L2